MPSELGDRTQLPKGVGWAVAVGLSSAWGMMDGLGSPPHPALGTVSGHRILWWLSKIFIKPTCSIQRKTLFFVTRSSQAGKNPSRFSNPPKEKCRKTTENPCRAGSPVEPASPRSGSILPEGFTQGHRGFSGIRPRILLPDSLLLLPQLFLLSEA